MPTYLASLSRYPEADYRDRLAALVSEYGDTATEIELDTEPNTDEDVTVLITTQNRVQGKQEIDANAYLKTLVARLETRIAAEQIQEIRVRLQTNKRMLAFLVS